MSTLPDLQGGQLVIVDSRPIWREGLARLLSSELGVEVSAVEDSSGVRSRRGATVAVLSRRMTRDLPGDCACVDLDAVADVDELVAAVRRAGAAPAGSVTSTPQRGPLTTRERSVLRAVARGLAATEIGAELGISARTVEHHRRTAASKIGARTTAQAVALAFTPDGS